MCAIFCVTSTLIHTSAQSPSSRSTTPWSAFRRRRSMRWTKFRPGPPGAPEGRGSARARLEGLPHFAVHDALAVVAERVARDHTPPETDGAGVAQVLGDLPAAGEAAEDEPDGSGADTEAAHGTRDEELRHAVIDGGTGQGACAGTARRACRRGRACAAAHDQRKADGLGSPQDHERKAVRIAEPVEELVGLAVADLAERRESARARGRRQIVEVIAIDALDPEPVTHCVTRIANTDRHD